MVLDADAKQLDITMNRRARIFKDRHITADKEKNTSLDPSIVYRNSRITSHVELLPEDL